MPAGKQEAVAGATADGAACGAALFANFYIPREAAPPLRERLRFLAQTPETITNSGQDPTDEPLLISSFDPPAAPDTTIIRLGLNASGSAADAWEATRQRLRDVLNSLDQPIDWWGYTLIYQAVLSPGVSPDSALEELLPRARRLYSSESLQPLAHDAVSGGQLWLLGIPNREDGLAAATVYAALSPPAQEQAFKKALLGPRLLYLDLIAHKGYSIQRQSRNVQSDYNDRLDAFRKATYRVLGDPEQQVEETYGLEKLAHSYRVFLSFVSELKRLHISIAQQLPNYNSWRAQMEGNNVVEYHYGHLEIANQELELMVAKGQDALETAKTAIDIAQVQIDEAQESRQQRIEPWLAAAALALALAKIIDHEAAWALLNHNTAWALLGLVGPTVSKDTPDGVLVLTITQVVIIAVVTLLAGLLVMRFLGKQRRKRRKDGFSLFKKAEP